MKRIIFIYFGAGLLWCLLLLYIPNFASSLFRWLGTLASPRTEELADPEQFSLRDLVATVLGITLFILPALLPFAAVGCKIAKLENPRESLSHRTVMAFGTTVGGVLALGVVFALLSLCHIRPTPH